MADYHSFRACRIARSPHRSTQPTHPVVSLFKNICSSQTDELIAKEWKFMRSEHSFWQRDDYHHITITPNFITETFAAKHNVLIIYLILGMSGWIKLLFQLQTGSIYLHAHQSNGFQVFSFTLTTRQGCSWWYFPTPKALNLSAAEEPANHTVVARSGLPMAYWASGDRRHGCWGNHQRKGKAPRKCTARLNRRRWAVAFL